MPKVPNKFSILVYLVNLKTNRYGFERFGYLVFKHNMNIKTGSSSGMMEEVEVNSMFLIANSFYLFYFQHKKIEGKSSKSSSK